MLMATRNLPKAVVPSVLKAARLLDEIAASRDALTLGELSARLELPKSSTLSLCTSLTVSGLLIRYDDGTYHLGTHLVDLAHAYLSRTDLTIIAAGATPDDEREFGVEGVGKRSRNFLAA